MKWRLGLDLGTNSIGWAVLELKDQKPSSLLDLGVRIFSDGRMVDKSGNVGDSLAVDRTAARQIRRQRYRTKLRKQAMLRLLTEMRLFPEDKNEQKELEKLNPYFLRAKAVEDVLTPGELGRVVFHLALRRGYKSNRKTDGNEEGAFFDKIENLKTSLGNKTLGQYLYGRLQRGERVRFSKEDECDLFPRREMYENEFQVIKSAQLPSHNLTEGDWQKLEKKIFFQRPLKPVERGKCSLYPNEERAFKDLPITHEFRILQDINNLHWMDHDYEFHELTKDQKSILLEKLRAQKSVSFDAMRNLKGLDKELLFPNCLQFNLERGKRKELNGHKINYDFRKSELFGPAWQELSSLTQNDLIEELYNEEDQLTLIELLCSNFNLSEQQAVNLSNYKLARKATSNLSRKAMEQLVPVMRETGKQYHEAVRCLKNEYGQSLHHSDKRDGVIDGFLPYYGEVLEGSTIGGDMEKYDPDKEPEKYYGKIGNPTVHIALNQLRKIVNELIGLYGQPDEIHVELSRDIKKSRIERDKITKQNRLNEKDRERILDTYLAPAGVSEPSAQDYKKFQLWEELQGTGMTRLCPYSGDIISAQMIINGEAQIEHILPFKRTLDNSRANLTIATVDANRRKAEQSPFEAFGNETTGKYAWEGIKQRAENLPDFKQWRFSEQAMDRFLANRDFLSRQLTDNAYLSRKTAQYLSRVCNPNKITSLPGQLTGLLRGKWGLNKLLGNDGKKNREDHRHHAIDAFVIAMTTRSVLQKISTARAADKMHKILVPELSDYLLEQARKKIEDLNVSLKPDHSTKGKLFKETAYGLIPEAYREKGYEDRNVVVRKPLSSLSHKNLNDIRDPTVRKKVIDWVEMPQNMDRNLSHVLKELSQFDFAKKVGFKVPIKNIRVMEKWQTVEFINSATFKGYVPDAYVCCYIWRVPKGKTGNWKRGEFKWEASYLTYEQADKLPDDRNILKPHPASKLEMILYKDDIVSFQNEGVNTMFKVYGFSTTNNSLDLRPLNISKIPQKFFSVNQLMKQGLRKQHISVTGKLR